ncbi:MAG: IS4 family transposase, partial [Acinetobacter sp.]
YTKKFDGYNHLVTLLFSNLAACDSLREVVVGMLSLANKLQHLGLNYIAKRSTLSDANKRRNSAFFAAIYSHLYHKYAKVLSDSRSKNERRLYIMDSTTISLFKQILKGAGRNPKRGKKKGGLKVHTLIASDENVPQLVIMSPAATHDHIMLKHLELPEGSFIVFDRAYVDYGVYESFSEQNITYVTKLKKNAKHCQIYENDLPENTDDTILIDELVEFSFGPNKGSTHRARRIACWDEKSRRVVEYLTNNCELTPNEIVEIYRRRWLIETLFKQMKQNFQLKYFLGDNVNAIECQVWVAMIANLLISIIKRYVRRVCSYTGIVSLIRLQLMSYISLYDLLEKPEQAWLNLLEKQKIAEQNSLFDM